jgi:hypothetical protein
MRMQLTRAGRVAASCLAVTGIVAAMALGAGRASADDRADVTTTWYQEQRQGGQGGLTIVHPQADVSVDMGENATLGVGYSADVVTGATAAIYQVDGISTATPFDDVRHEARLSLGFDGSRSRLSFFGGAGLERDYTSIIAGGSGSIDLPGKNTNLALSYTHNFDRVCDRENADVATPLANQALEGGDPCTKTFVLVEDTPGMTTWRSLDIDTLQATLTQNLSPTAVLQTSLFSQVLRGFQSNPYRRVNVGQIAQEHIPDVRARAALMVRINRFLPGIRGAVHASLRGYTDTWDVDAVSVEMGYSQYVGESLLLHARGRFHYQEAAAFYKDAFFYETEGPAGEYFTGDRELGRLGNALAGLRMSYLKKAEDGVQVWGVFDGLQLDLKGELLVLHEFPTGNVDENPLGIERQFLTSGQLLDAIVVQLGLLLSY